MDSKTKLAFFTAVHDLVNRAVDHAAENVSTNSGMQNWFGQSITDSVVLSGEQQRLIQSTERLVRRGCMDCCYDLMLIIDGNSPIAELGFSLDLIDQNGDNLGKSLYEEFMQFCDELDS